MKLFSLMLPYLLLAASVAAQPALPLTPAVLDITQALGALAGVTPTSSPDAIARALQGRLDYLRERNSSGRIYLPTGTWNIDKPLFMIDGGKELVGDGPGKTILHAAPGYAIPMVNVAVRSYQNERPLQTVNRVDLTSAAARILDASVTEPRYGLRTYAEYPADHFPTVNHLTTPRYDKLPNWKEGTSYRVDDVIHLSPANANRGVDGVCIRAHVASKDNQPFSGPRWKEDWVVRLPFSMQFLGDPISAGPLDPETHRATDWKGMQQFTLDFAFTLNAPPALFGTRPLVGVITGNCYDPHGRTWFVGLRDGNRLELNLSLADGTGKSIPIAGNITAAGTYRLVVQLDFAGGMVHAWVRRPGETDFTRTLDDTKSIPAGSTLQQLEYGFMTTAGDPYSGAASSNGNVDPPLDMTVCGLHLSNVLRYADSPTLQPRAGAGPSTDQSRYFTNDHGTFAFLPLTDNPPAADLFTFGNLITVQHGDAAGDPTTKGYGYFQRPCATMGIGGQRISDMSIITGPTWGAGLVSWNVIDTRYWNLDVHGGYYGAADLGTGAQYTYDVRNCNLSGSEAGYNGAMNITYFRNVTFNPVGRYGILLDGSNAVLDGATFTDPVTFRSEYYTRALGRTTYGGMNTLDHVTALAPAGSLFPSAAAFSMATQGPYRVSMVLDDCHVANLGPGASFLHFDPQNGWSHGAIAVTGSSYRGSPIAAFIRAESPWWGGPVLDLDHSTPVKIWVDQQPTPGVSPWKAVTNYDRGAIVTAGGKQYVSLTRHTSTAANDPTTGGGSTLWRPAVSNFGFMWKGR